MSYVPWHTPRSPNYHLHPRCPIGRYVAPHQRVRGTAGRGMCPDCQKLLASAPLEIERRVMRDERPAL